MILEALSYSREAVDQGNWWRLVTASISHLSWAHALGNAVAAVLLSYGLRTLLPVSRQLPVIAVGALATGLGIHLLSGLAWYAGLSGALWALAGCGAQRLAQREPLPGRGILCLLALAVYLDQYRTLSWSGDPLAPQAHLYGFVAGVACALLMRAPSRPQSRYPREASQPDRSHRPAPSGAHLVHRAQSTQPALVPTPERLRQ